MIDIKLLNKIIFIIVLSLIFQSCSINKIGTPFQLNNNEFMLINKWVKGNLVSCSFLFLPEKNINEERKIMGCIQDFTIDYRQASEIPEYLKDKIDSRRIDYYLTKKISLYLSKHKLTNSQLTTILHFVANAPYGENANLISLLIKKGAHTKNITIQQNLTTNGDTCKSSLVILKENATLYQNISLNQPAFDIEVSLTDKGYKKEIRGEIYRKNVLFSLVNDPAYVHCKDPVFLPKLINAIIHVNPSLRDIADDKTGETPLHYYLRYFQTRGLSNPVVLGRQLIDKDNINKKDKKGRTPLHTLLISQSLSQSNEYVLMVKTLISMGADLEVKDKNGISARVLISKLPVLKSIRGNIRSFRGGFWGHNT